MSSTSSAASAASVSDSNEPECVPSPSAKSTPTAEQFSLDIGQECPSSETSAPLLPTPSATRYGNNRGGGMGRVGPVRPSLDSLTSSAADFPVRTSASPERELVLQAREAGCGLSSLASLAKYDPATRSWRTSQHSVLGGLEPFSETWPRSGMTRSGTAFQLPTLAPLTDETESGSWPIPTVNGNYNRVGLSAQSGDGVATAVTRWPTPHGMCVPNKRRAGPSGKELGRAVNRWPHAECDFGPENSGRMQPGVHRPEAWHGEGEAVGDGCGRSGGQWLVEPDVGRVAHGVPARVDRLRSLGNAVVPQIPEIIGRAIMRLES